MPSYYPSPLRYPGGKTAIRGFISKIIHDNRLTGRHYIEPYVGGGGLALSLLFNKDVEYLHINDIDKGVADFWETVLTSADELIERITQTNINLAEWHKQRDIYEKEDIDIVGRAFATLFLNRTNYSGVLNGGVIGGKHQRGRYKMDCRFNKESLIEKIRRIHSYKDKIYISNMDAIDFIKKKMWSLPKDSLYYIDPPYFKKGKTLYTNFYTFDDHKKIAQLLITLSNPWIVTYDNVDEVRQLYNNQSIYLLEIKYSANQKCVSSECLIASKNLSISECVLAKMRP